MRLRAGLVWLLVAALLAVSTGCNEKSGTPSQSRALVPAAPSPSPAPADTRASPAATATASPSRPPTPTPPPPTAQPVVAPTYLVTTAPVGCHQEPAAGAAIVAQHSIGVVQQAAAFIRLTDGTWHRLTSGNCWVRTEPGPIRSFPTQGEADRFAQSIRPTPPPTLAPTRPPATPAPPPPAPAATPATAGRCDPSYPTVCIPPYPPDLDCGDIPHRRFAVRPPDPHRFDADRDGIGCES